MDSLLEILVSGALIQPAAGETRAFQKSCWRYLGNILFAVVQKYDAAGRVRFRISEAEPQAELCGKRNADCRAGPKEIAQCPGGNPEVSQAGDGARRGAGRIETEGRGVGEIIHRRGQRGEIRHEIVAGRRAIVEVVEFEERA